MRIAGSVLVCGIGINDANYPIQHTVDGKRVRCPYYQAWKNMLTRCTPEEGLRRPSYAGTTVCKEWKSFMAFRRWMLKQDWQGNALDKDILGIGKKHYSPETCLFVSPMVNMFIVGLRGKGWQKDRRCNAYQAKAWNGTENQHLGSFKTAQEARYAWIQFKSKRAKLLIHQQTNTRVRTAIRKYMAHLTQI